MQKKIYVVGMFDDDSANKVQSAVAGVAGVTSVVASTEKSQVLVDFDEAMRRQAMYRKQESNASEKQEHNCQCYGK